MSINTSAIFNNLKLQSPDTKELSVGLPSQPTVTPKAEFSKMLKQAIDNVNGLQQSTTDLRNRFEMGDTDVSLGQVMIAANKSSLAFDATVQVRNKMVDAYKEIMSMPV